MITTINIVEDLWTRFGIIVLVKKGGRKKNDKREKLSREYVEDSKGKALKDD